MRVNVLGIYVLDHRGIQRWVREIAGWLLNALLIEHLLTQQHAQLVHGHAWARSQRSNHCWLFIDAHLGPCLRPRDHGWLLGPHLATLLLPTRLAFVLGADLVLSPWMTELRVRRELCRK
jgi:hypothetical protein